ncbi:hypothetical protein DERF_005019 [Dermatophagoides farinae]|uniref:Uncharacterized protein n=1 Tax=Dermatophagoides farinae TaxID=6954 RepID=A0A922I4G4_DERFA|nr:hypothetical protein DERF_005019 [Dermatophagoides farinae]
MMTIIDVEPELKKTSLQVLSSLKMSIMYNVYVVLMYHYIVMVKLIPENHMQWLARAPKKD